MEEDKRENVEAKHGEFTKDEVNEKDAQPEIETSVLDLAFEQPSNHSLPLVKKIQTWPSQELCKNRSL